VNDKILLVTIGLLIVLVVSCEKVRGPQSTPTITLSIEKISNRGHVEMRGTGFTPKSVVKSHLRRPNKTNFPALNIRTDDRGEFLHVIDTLTLDVGIHEVWITDSTGTSSNTATFEVRP
jgi:hypothetical protein